MVLFEQMYRCKPYPRYDAVVYASCAEARPPNRGRETVDPQYTAFGIKMLIRRKVLFASKWNQRRQAVGGKRGEGGVLNPEQATAVVQCLLEVG